ncbi:hypothetical protein JQ617_02350 [Bradyrhizobium sp. KB893862 SZCCT0404]|uniref:hypothetical protein n=1 Tax=Bradyrhizobium sp. KB893862 SZCCT0404 TaxID=2807672 RepID=UPI001BACA8D6|nr:hypothetical protein [Bradyrhizobium sp. KB893862 SZCCT0404]MBR1172784.1 hypothetical protein [Bradyrhizobium sp. KB893862 SZCCT0404]
MTFEDWMKVGELVKWPLVALIVAVIALLILKKPISALLARMKRAAIGDKAVDFSDSAAIASEQQQKNQIEKPTAPETPSGELPPPPAPPALAAMEKNIVDTLAASNASDEVKRLWLIRGMAVAKMERAHEITYRLIMGSQIGLLLQANTGVPTSMESARAIYDDAKNNFPAIYNNFDFDGWLTWPSNTGLINIEQHGVAGSIITITDIGKEFLHYLVSAGLTSTKIG